MTNSRDRNLTRKDVIKGLIEDIGVAVLVLVVIGLAIYGFAKLISR